MRLAKTITAAMLGVGLTALTPTLSQAAEHRQERNDRQPARVEERHAPVIHEDVHVREVRGTPMIREGSVRVLDPRVNVVVPPPVVVYDADFDQVIGVQSVPGVVLDAVARNGNGFPIERIDYVRRTGQLFYDVTVGRPGAARLVVRVSADGQYLGGE